MRLFAWLDYIKCKPIYIYHFEENWYISSIQTMKLFVWEDNVYISLKISHRSLLKQWNCLYV